MKRHPIFSSILLFIVAVLSFLLSEVYFFGNPMFYQNDFFMLYHGPILLHLLSLIASVGLSCIEHGCARGLLLALSFLVCTVMIGINAWVFAVDYSVQAIYYFYNKSLWLSLSLLFSSAFTTALVIRSGVKARPRRCCALLFVLALCCVLLGGLSFIASPYLQAFLRVGKGSGFHRARRLPPRKWDNAVQKGGIDLNKNDTTFKHFQVYY